MHILIFHQFYTGSNEPGIARFNLLGKEWVKNGHTVTIIAGAINYITGKKKKGLFGKFWWKERDESGIEVVRVWSTACGLGYKSFLGRACTYSSFLKSAYIAGLFIKKPDIVIASSPPIFIGLIAYWVSRLKRVPFIFEVRDLWPDELIELGGLKNEFAIRMSYRLEKFLYTRARRLTTNSPGIRRFLMERKDVREEKISVIENPVTIDEEHTSEHIQAMWRGKVTILYSGNHGRVYDFDVLLDAVSELYEKDNTIQLVLIGDGKQKNRLRARIQKENIPNVILMDPVPKSEIGGYIDAADICVVSIRDLRLIKNVYATKLFEYMAHKKPIILAMEGVSKALIADDAQSGITLPPGDKAGIKRAILELKNNPEKMKKFAANGYKYVQEHVTAPTLAEKYLQCIIQAREKNS
jgi:glycosyltransferase involved in cell wall biosynthesis